MVDISYQMVLSTLQTVGLLVGIFYYLTILRNAQKNRTIEMVFQRTQTRTPEYYQNINEISPMIKEWNTAEEFWETYNVEKTPKLMAIRSSIVSGLNAWGYLVREGLVDLDFVCRFNYPIWIIRFWKVNEPIFRRNRELHDPEMNKDFEFLYNAVKKKYPHIDEDSRRGQDMVIEKMKKDKEAETSNTQN